MSSLLCLSIDTHWNHLKAFSRIIHRSTGESHVLDMHNQHQASRFSLELQHVQRWNARLRHIVNSVKHSSDHTTANADTHALPQQQQQQTPSHTHTHTLKVMLLHSLVNTNESSHNCLSHRMPSGSCTSTGLLAAKCSYVCALDTGVPDTARGLAKQPRPPCSTASITSISRSYCTHPCTCSTPSSSPKHLLN